MDEKVMLSEDGSITKFITKIKRNKMSDIKWKYSDVVVEKEEKKFWYKIEDSLYDDKEKKEEKYKQLEFEFDEDLVAPI